jgi:hypothetical protein
MDFRIETSSLFIRKRNSEVSTQAIRDVRVHQLKLEQLFKKGSNALFSGEASSLPKEELVPSFSWCSHSVPHLCCYLSFEHEFFSGR